MKFKHEHIIATTIIFVVAGTYAFKTWKAWPPLTTLERGLVGNWVTRVRDTKYYNGSSTKSREHWELRRDHTYSRSVITPGNPEYVMLNGEGRWAVEGSRLHLKAFKIDSRTVNVPRDILNFLLSRGKPWTFPGANIGLLAPIRLIDGETWEMETPYNRPIIWKRVP
ncbi:hypothetical protein EP7_004911 [Isosphaeraceae bacterium EP7]